MTLLEAKQRLARKLNINYAKISSNALWSEADLVDLIDEAAGVAWDYKPWPFKEDTKKFSPSPRTEYYDYPLDFEDLSIERLAVAGQEFTKKDFADYEKWFN